MRLLTVIIACPALFAADSPIPRYEVHRSPSAILIDGTPNEKAWTAAPPIQFLFPWDSQTGAKQKTTARALWDDDNLYVSYVCEDTDITVTRTEHDAPTYLDDAVEFFVNPMPSQADMYYGLEMNAGGVLYDYVMYRSKYLFKQFDLRGVKLATSIDRPGNRWTLEVAIPWSNFDGLAKRPTAGTTWRANLNRWDGTEPNRRMSNWSDPMQPRPNPHVPERFGELIFVD